MTTIGGLATAGTRLKATSGWNNDGNGQDTYGFSALPAGFYAGSSEQIGNIGSWWSASEFSGIRGVSGTSAYHWYMSEYAESAHYNDNPKDVMYNSVRCLKD